MARYKVWFNNMSPLLVHVKRDSLTEACRLPHLAMLPQLGQEVASDANLCSAGTPLGGGAAKIQHNMALHYK